MHLIFCLFVLCVFNHYYYSIYSSCMYYLLFRLFILCLFVFIIIPFIRLIIIPFFIDVLMGLLAGNSVV